MVGRQAVGLVLACALFACTATHPATESGPSRDARPDTVAQQTAPEALSAPIGNAPPEWLAKWTQDPAQVKVVPLDPASLPLAPLVDVTADYGASPTSLHHLCVAVADFDGNGREDFAVVRKDGLKSVLRTLLLGPEGPKAVETELDSVQLKPNFACSAADMNGDAKPDLLFGGHSGAALYLGDGKGSFTDASAEWLPYDMDFQGVSLVPSDLDGDGDLDLFVGAGWFAPTCDQVSCDFTATDLVCAMDPPLPLLPGLQDRVLIREAQLPLVDRTQQWQVPGGGHQTVAMAHDVDQDGRPDLLVGDDFGACRLLHNQGQTFGALVGEVGLHDYSGSMGWTVGDFNDDGLFDLVLAEGGPTPVYLQTGAKHGKVPQFVDMGGKLGVWAATWTASAWAPLAADFDHDGLDDLLLGVGINFSPQTAKNITAVCTGSKGSDPFVNETSIDVLFLQVPGKGLAPYRLPAGQFSHVVFVEQKLVDLDGDGDLDVVQTRPGKGMEPVSLVRVLRNDIAKAGGSFIVVLTGKGGNMDALGSKVTARIGGKVRTRWLQGSGGFGGTPSRFAHFGLGSAGVATDVTVTWPDGKTTALGSAKAGVRLTATWP